MRRHNDRTEILASELPPSSVSIIDNSGQRIRIDLTQDEHLAFPYTALQAADNRRAVRVHVVLMLA